MSDPEKQPMPLRLAAMTFDPLEDIAKLPEELRSAKVPEAGGAMIVQLKKSPTREERARLQSQYGMKLDDNVPECAYVETVGPETPVDLPAARTTALTCKGLDGAWVQFNDITIDSAKWVDAPTKKPGTVSLPRTEIVLHDKSGGSSTAFLYQPTGHKVQAGQRLRQLRGFVHAEAPGVYVLLSDKEEDMAAKT